MRLAFLAGFVPVVCSCALVAEGADAVRIRVEWGGGASRTWSGVLEVRGGRFDGLEPLGVDAEQPGTLWVDERIVWIQRRTPRLYDGFDIEVEGGAAATLRVTLQSRDDPPVRTGVDVPLEDLFEGDRAVAIGDGGDRVVLRRAPGDVLRLRTSRPHLVFDPGETFEATVAIDVRTRERAEGTESGGRFRWTLSPARENRVLARGETGVVLRTNGEQPDAIPLAVRLPHSEGAYDLHLALESRTLRHESRVQIVVASSKRPSQEPETDSPGGDAGDRVVDTIEAAGLADRRLDDVRRDSLFRKSLDEVARLWSFGASALPEEPTPGTEADWAAYSLNVEALGRLHHVVVTFDAQPARQVALSVLHEPAANELVPAGPSAAFTIGAGEEARADAAVVRYAVPFWPSTRRPVVLIQALDAGPTCGVQRIEVVEPGEEGEHAVPPVERSSGRRIAGVYFHRPLRPATLGGTDAVDAPTGRRLDDWRTFDEAGRHLARQLRRTGHNAAMMAVLSEGSALFPSRHLRSSLRCDTGRHFSDGVDPMPKDVVELLLRRFDREGLVFVPLLRFSSVLTALERRGGTGLDDAELVDADGRSWRDVHGDARTGGPFYDPLDERVQQALLEAVREFAERYADHPSLAAVAIDLGPETYLRYPGDEWGYGTATIDRYVRETGASFPPLPTDPQAARRARVAALRTELREAWFEWRADRLADLHGRVAAAITAARPELDCVFVVEAPPAAQRGETGVDTERLSRIERSYVLERSGQHAGTEPLPGRRGSVVFGEPIRRRVERREGGSGWPAAPVSLAADVAPSGSEGRRPYARAVANDDVFVFRGGWGSVLEDDPATRAARRSFGELPDTRLVAVPDTPQPLAVRVARGGGRTWIAVVNDFPHAATATLSLDGESPGADEEVRLELEAYGVRTSSRAGEVRVTAVQVALGPEVESELRRRLEALDRVITTFRARGSPRRGALENPGFELAGASEASLPGWSIPVRPAASWSLDEEHPRSGRAALLLEPGSAEVAAIGSDVPLRDERHVLVTAWMRSDAEAAEARLVFEAVVDGRERRRFAPVRVGTRWTRFDFRVDDVPTGIASARLRFEVRGPARLWIDDVDVRLSHATATELRDFETAYAAADFALARKRYSDARRLLEGPWQRFALPETDDEAAAAAPPTEPDPATNAEQAGAASWWSWNPFR